MIVATWVVRALVVGRGVGMVVVGEVIVVAVQIGFILVFLLHNSPLDSLEIFYFCGTKFHNCYSTPSSGTFVYTHVDATKDTLMRIIRDNMLLPCY